MSFEIVERTVNGETDKRAVVDNLHSPLVRKMGVGSDWTKIRIGARFSTRRETEWVAAPYFYFGLCSGTSAPPGSLTPNHFFGLRTNDLAWNKGTGTNATMIRAFFNISLIGNGSESTAPYAAQSNTYFNPGFAIAELRSFALILDITKGAPYTLESAWTGWRYPDHSHCNVATFSDTMNASSITALPIHTSSQYGYVKESDSSYTPDEVTYGDLDSICFVFLGNSDAFEVSDIAYTKLA